MLLFITTFCKINFSSVSLNTELGQQASLLKVGRALWILKNNVIKGENP